MILMTFSKIRIHNKGWYMLHLKKFLLGLIIPIILFLIMILFSFCIKYPIIGYIFAGLFIILGIYTLGSYISEEFLGE